MIGKEEIKKMAELSRVEVKKKDIDKYSKQLSSILDFFQILNKVNTENVSPLINSVEIMDVVFEDKASDFDSTEKIIENFPMKKDRYLKTKSILN